MGIPKSYSTKVAANGQIVIPKELRDALGLKGGDIILFCTEEQPAGFLKIVLRRPSISFKSIVGTFKELSGRPLGQILRQIDDEEKK